jgi:hypothetical protein
VLQIAGGWRYYTNPPFANKLYAAGATAYAAGTGINIAETLRLQLAFELKNRRQRKLHKTAKDTFQNRLDTINRMRDQLSPPAG